MVLRFKVDPPRLPICIDRPRLIDAVDDAPIVVLVAPAGYGKTCLAAQLAAAAGGPVAWYTVDELDRDLPDVVEHLLAALSTAWPDVSAAPGRPDERTALGQLAAALETTSGPGALVVDDLHHLADTLVDPVLHVLTAATPSDVRLVVTSRVGLGEVMLGLAAAGRAAVLGADALAFDQCECAQAAGDGGGEGLFARTGGWPLAVRIPLAAGGPPFDEQLAELVLAGLDTDARVLLHVAAHIPRCPWRLLARVGSAGAALNTFVTSSPSHFVGDDAWWAPRDWLRDQLRRSPPNPWVVDLVADTLVELDEHELAARLLVVAGHSDRAVGLVEQLASDGLRRGRAAWVRALISDIPPASRSFELDLLAAAAAQTLSIADPTQPDCAAPQALHRLVDEAHAHGRGAVLRARALVASHLRLAGDPRLLGWCADALGGALSDIPPVDDVPDDWPVGARASLDERWAAAELVRFAGQALVFTGDRALISRGRRLVALALDQLERAGRSATSQRGWWAYTEVLLHVRDAAEAIPAVRLAAHQLAEVEHGDASLRLAELATLEFFVGDGVRARRTIEHSRDLAARTGNTIALVALDSIETGLDVERDGFSDAVQERFQRISAQLAADRRLAPFQALIAAEFGITLVRIGELGPARRVLGQAEAALGSAMSARITALRCRRLHGLLLLAEGRVGDGRAELEALRDDAVAEGRDALATTVEVDLAGGNGRHDALAQPVDVSVLGPEITISIGDDPSLAPRGYPAKLLAHLVAAGGLMTIDAAIERLWPGADPAAGRNRLHGVILRLRRGLGFGPDGPIGCTDGIVRLERGTELRVDSWEFERSAACAVTDVDARSVAIARYRGDVLSVQFAYDDEIELYRTNLRQRFERLVDAEAAERRRARTAGGRAHSKSGRRSAQSSATSVGS